MGRLSLLMYPGPVFENYLHDYDYKMRARKWERKIEVAALFASKI